MNWIWITTTKALTYLDKHDCRDDIIMTGEVELLNMIFQHMLLSGKPMSIEAQVRFCEGSGALPSLSEALLLWNAF